MKKFLVFLCAMFCTVASAHTINWRADGEIIQTTTCDSGDTVSPPIAPVKYGYHLKEWNPTYEYTYLEYIQSTGTQYIDTGVAVNDNNSFEIQYAAIGAGGGQLISQGNNSLRLLAAEKSTWFSANYNFPMDIVLGSFYTVNCGQDYANVDGVAVSGVSDHDRASGISVYLFANNSGTLATKAQVKYFKIWDGNNVLVRDMKPAKRNTDDAIGMYDVVTRTFFVNAGTGEFIAGPVVQ